MKYESLLELSESVHTRAAAVQQGIQIPEQLCQSLKAAWGRCVDCDRTAFRIRSGTSHNQEVSLNHRSIIQAAIGSILTAELHEYKKVYENIFENLNINGDRQKKLFAARTNATNVGAEWTSIETKIDSLGLTTTDAKNIKRFALDNQWSGCTKGIGRGDFYLSAVCHALGTNPTNQPMIAVASKDFISTNELKLIASELINIANGTFQPNSEINSNSNSSSSSLVKPFVLDAATAFLHVDHTIAHRLTSSLLSKRFLIATGLAGSGKTKLAQAFARWITPLGASSTDINYCYAIVAVGADWTGNENILGYPDGLQPNNYVAKPALDLILHAADHSDVPHFLILDEMNLSHVERYFADILSIIESDEGLDLYSGDMTKPERWRKTSAAKVVPPKLKQLPENLFIIGTVNVDETTYMFSPKVLDRANVIEFRMDAAELEGFLGNPAKPELKNLDGKGASFGKAFVDAAKSPVTVPGDVKAAYDAEMLLLFKTLQAHGAEFGYRTAYETARFIHFYKLLGNHADGDATWFPGAFDCVVFQKLLPKLHGSRAKLGPVLKKLWFLCVNDATGRGADALKAAEEAARSTDKKAEPSVVVPTGAPYPLSAEKIGRMWRLLIENGFASFAEA